MKTHSEREATQSSRARQAPPTEEEIRTRAYRVYESRLREGVPGDAESDWLRAEHELRRRAPA